ncbi:MACPF domain-containing protein CAD1-like protein isoform X1 [Cinnamomum micranthum f. kanehirae]|uniref:MACPF domain-containing protein CAD1-like protein isoform X1 n=1 Tax=Cinnamomum micranthum f. kanehirae TaxID=337451 RepID=A0A3S3NK22_9MAGN|nr:MACPF domain-containing protein CAD1-like protein isoform X1 [Cinnamomum micranthum f. kanehirae]
MENPTTVVDSSASASTAADAALTTLCNSIQALGRGFDVTSDMRLLYCKGASGSRLVYVDEDNTRDLVISHGLVLPNVSADIELSRGDIVRETTSVLSFHEMAEHFNKKSDIPGNIPLGSFNSMFNFTGSWQVDAAATKSLAMDGCFIPLYKVQLTKIPLVLHEYVKHAIPLTWEPSSLASFIENFGTHIITSTTIGGRDVVYIKQHQSSPLSTSDIKNYLKDIGDQRFSDLVNQPGVGPFKYKDKATNNREIHPQSSGVPYLSGKEDVTVIFRRRGGNDLVQNLALWSITMESSPDVINMTFVPIVSLLDGSPGIKHLARAIDLYLEYKPPIEELQYFLEFQIPRVWAPVQNNHPGHQRKEPICRFLQYSLMGPKLYISSEQISVGRKPVTGLRLCLEGSKQNRLAIHLQHLASLPKILQPHWDPHVAIGAPKWQGPEEQDSRWFEPIKWKNFSHVSTAPIENTETSIGDLSGAHIVTGAQLGVWDFGSKSVLHLKLLFSRVPGCTIRRSVWDHSPSNISHLRRPDNPSSSSTAEEMSSDDKRSDNKLVKIVDLTEMSKGPQDIPGHWLVTGAKLGVEKGKIVLRVKYSLLNY